MSFTNIIITWEYVGSMALMIMMSMVMYNEWKIRRMKNE